MYLIAGLGNPSPDYDGTRHNIGREAVWFWLAPLALAEGPSKGKIPNNYPQPLPGEVNIPKFEGRAHRIPTNNDGSIVTYDLGTYMNEAGPVVVKLLQFFKIPATNLILVHDELALPLGKLRLDRNISSAGHHGVQSVIDALGTQDFIRLRLGIESRAEPRVAGENFVLQKFSSEEKPIQDELLTRAAGALTTVLTTSLERAITKYNRATND